MMKSSRKVLATTGVAAGAIAVVLTSAFSASASTQGAGPKMMGFESIDGYLSGPGALSDTPVVRVRLSGAVNTDGGIMLGRSGPIARIPTFRGTLAAETGYSMPSERVNRWTCQVTDTTVTSYRVDGRESSGVFSGAEGGGRAVTVFSAVMPRHRFGPHRGECDFGRDARPEPFGASISFHAQGPLFVRHY
jgi:hypothetical protein